MDNGIVKAKFVLKDGHISQDYYAKHNTQWTLVLSNFISPKDFPVDGAQLYNASLDKANRFLVSDALQNMNLIKRTEEEVVVELSGFSGRTPISQVVSLHREQSYFHVDVKAQLLNYPPKVDYLLSAFTFANQGVPSFVHTPGMKFDNEDSKQNRFKLLPGKDQVIGDRAFHAPAIVLQKNKIFAALVPDLNAINTYAVTSPDARRSMDIGRNIFSIPEEVDKYTMPTGLDLNVKSGLTNKPLLAFGYMDNIIAHHIHYQRKQDSTMVRTLTSNNLRYEFDLFVAAGVEDNFGFQKITSHQWKQFGHSTFVNHAHLTLPFEEYFRIVDSITFRPSKNPEIDLPLQGYEDHGSWIEFEMNGQPVGGYRSAINWWNDVIHNSTFWNNARDASGFYFWGKKQSKPILLDRARRIINFCLQAPQNERGLFATLYNANAKTWGLQFSDPPHGKNQFFLRESDSYDVPSMSKTGAHLLDYYIRCEKDQRIVDYLRPYGDWLITSVDKRGAVPSYVTNKMEISPLLFYSSQPAASMWFLASLYNVTKEMKYLDAAKQIARFLENEILPEQKWVDMEQYYSCGAKPLAFERDVWQNQPARGNLATIWASEGFAQLYMATKDSKYLKDGESCIDYLSFSQCSWAPHFIYTAYPFGGFTADNTDNATMLDARQAETVKPFIWYGKILGRQDLLERGVAAARASVVLLNLPSHHANDIYAHTNIYPYGLGPENIDHEGHPQSAMRTHPSWGEGSGVFTGLAEAYRELNGGYIDFEKGIQVGVNGIVIQNASLSGSSIKLSIANQLSKLTAPWKSSYQTQLSIVGLKVGQYKILLNGADEKIFSDQQLKSLTLKVNPDGTIEI
ncbi:MAG: hypothetical protein ORN54_13950 [Cyclobacteriaceae bacterium]|nr:hypothetical protein [Cyclobacteriaceae bacterium]